MSSLLGFNKNSSRGAYKAAAVSGIAEIKLDMDMKPLEIKQEEILANTKKISEGLVVLGPNLEKLKIIVKDTECRSSNRVLRVLNSVSDAKDDILDNLDRGHKQQKQDNCCLEKLVNAKAQVLEDNIEENTRATKQSSKCIIQSQKELHENLVSTIDSRSTKEHHMATKEIQSAVEKNGKDLQAMAMFLSLAKDTIRGYHDSLQKELQCNKQVLTNTSNNTTEWHRQLCKVAEMLEIVKKTNGNCYSDLRTVIGRLDSIDQNAKHRHDDLCRVRTELSSAIGKLGSKMDAPRNQVLLGKLDTLINLVGDLQSVHERRLKKLEKHVCDTQWELTCRIDQHNTMVQKIESNHVEILDRLNEIEGRNSTRIKDVLEQITEQNKTMVQNVLHEFTERNKEFACSHADTNNNRLIESLSQIVEKSSKEHESQLEEIKTRVVETESVITAFTGERTKQVQRDCETYAKSLYKAQENLDETRQKLAEAHRENDHINGIAHQLLNISSKNGDAISSADVTTKTASKNLTMQQMHICESYPWLGRSFGLKKEKLQEIFASVKRIDSRGCFYGEGDAALGRVTLYFESTDLKRIREEAIGVAKIFEEFSRAQSAEAAFKAEDLWDTFFSFSNKAGCHVNGEGHIVTSSGHVIGRLDLETPSRPSGHRHTDSGSTVFGNEEDTNVKGMSATARVFTTSSDFTAHNL